MRTVSTSEIFTLKSLCYLNHQGIGSAEISSAGHGQERKSLPLQDRTALQTRNYETTDEWNVPSG